jgi:Flp pilus assembly protein TadG
MAIFFDNQRGDISASYAAIAAIVGERRSRLPSLWRCSRGTGSVEFSLIALPLFGLIIAILQIGIVFIAQQELESAVEKSARALLVGNAQQANVTRSQFATSVCGYLPVLFTCSQVMIDLQTAASFSAANTATPTLTYDSSGNVTNAWQYQLGASGSIMVLRVIYQFPVVFGPLGFNLSNLSNGKRLIMSTSVFQVEPYSS